MKSKLIFQSFLLLTATSIIADMGPSYVYSDQDMSDAAASSFLIEKGRPEYAYSPENVTDRDQTTAWCAGNKNGGIGEWIEVNFTPEIAETIVFVPGFSRSRGLYYKNNRIRDYEMVVTHANGRLEKIRGTLPDKDFCGQVYCRYSPDYEEEYDACVEENKNNCGEFNGNDSIGADIPLKQLSCVKAVRVKILSVYRGSKYNDSCIAEIALSVDAWGALGRNQEKAEEQSLMRESCQ